MRLHGTRLQRWRKGVLLHPRIQGCVPCRDPRNQGVRVGALPGCLLAILPGPAAALATSSTESTIPTGLATFAALAPFSTRATVPTSLATVTTVSTVATVAACAASAATGSASAATAAAKFTTAARPVQMLH